MKGSSARATVRRHITDPPMALIVGLLFVHVLAAAWVLGRAPGPGRVTDVNRFQQIANSTGRPYRDFPVEYAPVELGAIELLAGPTVASTYRHVVAAALLLDLATWWLVSRGWGRGAGVRYLLLGVPLLLLLFIRLDLLTVALAVAGLALARARRDRLGGVALAVASLAKVWPAFVAPSLLKRGRTTALWWFAGAATLGLAAWILVSGADAAHQVATFRGARGWQIESTVGTVVWLVTGGPVRFEQGAARVGVIPDAVRVGLLLVLAIVTVATWRRARWWPGASEGVPSLVSVTALIVLSPLFSLQYVIWLLPWLAIAAGEPQSRRFVRVGVGIVILTGAIMGIYVWAPFDALLPVVAVALLARNALCVLVVVTWFRPWPPEPLRATVKLDRMEAPAPVS